MGHSYLLSFWSLLGLPETLANIDFLLAGFSCLPIIKSVGKNLTERKLKMEKPQMHTINETAQILGLAKYYIRQLVLQNKISYVRSGKKYLINLDKAIDYLNTGDNKNTSFTSTNKIKRVGV